MKLDKKDLLLYAVTDRAWTGNTTLEYQIRQAIEGGVSIVQLREKNLKFDEFLSLAFKIKDVCKEYGIPFIINDNVDITIKCFADGVHIGQSDEELSKVRKKLGVDKIIGVSVQTVSQAILAEKNGADYLGVGAVFKTSTKNDAKSVSYDVLKDICSAVKIPVVAIGGINKENIENLEGSNISGVAVVSAIFAKQDIKSSSEDLLKEIEKIVK